MAKILVVDDEPSIREMLEIYLQREGYEVTCASNGQDALTCCKKQFYDLVVADIKMPKMDGISLLHEVKAISPATVFIMITAFGSFETAKESMDDDAYDYITKPFDVEEIKKKIDTALRARKQSGVTEVRTKISDEKMTFGMIGQSKQMQKVFDLIPRAASSKSNVLIVGESGTGKELVARAIHYHSPRNEYPFVVINCGGIPDTLLESELFGYKKGAFTGATHDKKGFLEVAHGGTLFLDEVGELPLALQVKLLRMVQEKTFTPIGGTQEHKVDVRIISATNKNLEQKIKEGSFREDLFYRLNVINIYIPPLRDRTMDIPLLVNYFSKKCAQEMQKDVSEISSFAMNCLTNYHFPGNVRELENIIEKGVALAKTSIMLPDSLTVEQAAEAEPDYFIPPDGIDLEEILTKQERKYIEEALKLSRGSVKGAAKLLGITFKSMRYRLEKLAIDKNNFK